MPKIVILKLIPVNSSPQQYSFPTFVLDISIKICIFEPPNRFRKLTKRNVKELSAAWVFQQHLSANLQKMYVVAEGGSAELKKKKNPRKFLEQMLKSQVVHSLGTELVITDFITDTQLYINFELNVYNMAKGYAVGNQGSSTDFKKYLFYSIVILPDQSYFFKSSKCV